ncbi:MAG: hypothetical protein OEY24_01925 [Candidatus Bathyarchaeota archaeon]|nr:hypothetical protein [Candidatus Bathyarchaeota archaeon]MDH5494448.1 hypothetical protein [Candidatus Bathyarchaeota archaeon]
MPEFFMLLGIDFFLATSLLTCIFDKYFPDKLAYLYQLVALAGFGQLLVTREFMASFPDYMRFWYSFIYLIIAVTNIAALNVYLFFYKKTMTIAKLFSIVATAPAFIISTMFLYNYAVEAPHAIIPLPQLPLDLMFISVFAFDTIVVSVGIYALIKPKWWQITIPSAALLIGATAFVSIKPTLGESAFIVGAIYVYIILGIACVGVLGASVYVLLRFWRDIQRKKGGEITK